MVVVPSKLNAMQQCHGVVKEVSVGSKPMEVLFVMSDGWIESLMWSGKVFCTAVANAYYTVSGQFYT